MWGLGEKIVAWQWWRERAIPKLGRGLLALFGAAALALGLSAAQLLPSLEFTAQSVRAVADGPHAVYPFSVEPWRAIEWISAQRLRTARGPQSKLAGANPAQA